VRRKVLRGIKERRPEGDGSEVAARHQGMAIEHGIYLVRVDPQLLLVLTLSEVPMGMIVNLKTVKIIWTALRLLFLMKANLQTLQLIQNLHY
jgi:hypothetical protein